MYKRVMRYGDENESLMDAGQQALVCDNIDVNSAVNKVFGAKLQTPSECTFHDADLDKWIEGRFNTHCGAALMKSLLLDPNSDKEVVALRQKLITQPRNVGNLLEDAKKLERDALWVLVKPEIKPTWPLPFLFPTMFGIRKLNDVPLFHEVYHFWRLFANPVVTVMYPFGMILGPWMYFRIKLGWKLSFKVYIKFILKMFRAMKGGAAIKVWGTLALYAGLYLYSLIQVIDISRMIGSARQLLAKRQRNVARLMMIANKICNGADTAFYGEKLHMKPGTMGFLGVWEWWSKPATMDSIKNALKIIAAADVVAASIKCLKLDSNWCAVEIEDTSVCQQPRFYGMRHPALGESCVANPAALDRNIILTGPNAAGKTTYCRGLLANIMLAQTLGIACASRAMMGGQLFGGIVSFMRISDETGSASLFEAEVARCVEMWKMAEEQINLERSVFMVLDEPMHATPPTEGAAAAMAFMKGLSRMGREKVRVVVTTHYAPITSLESEDFINVSMEAMMRNGEKITFPYRLRSGPSFQSIALELMQERGAFPGAFVEDALKIKEKIGCREIVNG